METKSTKYKQVLFFIVLLGINVPLIQYFAEFSYVLPLKGAIVEPEKPQLNLDSLNTGAYQEKFNKYYNEKFGFRSAFIRFHNQLKYNVFNQAQANGVVVGKDDYLFELDYIKAYYGQDYIGMKNIYSNASKLKRIQDTLSKLNKTLVIVLNPGKATFFPEFIPDSRKVEIGTTNLEVYRKYFRRFNINYLDFNAWFLKLKKHTKYPLYAKGGIHWSKYGEIIAGDSLIKFIEKISKLDYPNIMIQGVDVKKENSNGDFDIGEGMNLIYPTTTYPMAYPKFSLVERQNSIHRTLFVSDSYYWGLFNYGFSQSIFGNGQFWYYNNEVYPENYTKPTHVADLNFKKEILSNDVIVLMSTDANLSRFPFGFIEDFYKNFFPNEK